MLSFAPNRPRRPNRHSEVDSAIDLPPPKWGWPELFLIAQTALPAVLYFPGTQAIRTPIRVAPFILGLISMGYYITNPPPKLRPHPSRNWLIAVFALLLVMYFHPDSEDMAGVAQIALCMSVISPFFFIPAMVRGPKHLERLLAILLICNGINAAVGVLQVYNPDRFMPKELSSATRDKLLRYVGAHGVLITRPTGLFDTPGAVSGSGMVATVLGLIIGATKGASPQIRIVGLLMAFAGVAVIYLTHVRSCLVVAMFSAGVYAAILVVQGQSPRAIGFGTLCGALAGVAFLFSIALGGNSIQERFASLFEKDPYSTYRDNRGIGLEYGVFEMIFELPVGGGLGRYGTIAGAFGAKKEQLFAELQFNAWIIDGGILMAFFYMSALIANAYSEYRLAMTLRDDVFKSLAAAVFAVNLGTLLLTLSFPPFMTQVGIQYWFLSGALHGCVWNCVPKTAQNKRL